MQTNSSHHRDFNPLCPPITTTSLSIIAKSKYKEFCCKQHFLLPFTASVGRCNCWHCIIIIKRENTPFQVTLECVDHAILSSIHSFLPKFTAGKGVIIFLFCATIGYFNKKQA